MESNNEYKKAFDYALDLLAITSKTEKELTNKLIQKKYDEDIIKCVIDRLKELEYINDKEYVSQWIELKKEQNAINVNVIYQKLINKGIDKCLIDEAIGNNQIDEYSSAYSLAEKKFQHIKGTKAQVSQKLMQYLFRKGYNVDTCRKVAADIMYDNVSD